MGLRSFLVAQRYFGAYYNSIVSYLSVYWPSTNYVVAPNEGLSTPPRSYLCRRI